ncbi:MAG: hypothetical protein V1645_04515 [archaeon]
MPYDSFIKQRIPLDVRNSDRLAFGFLRSIVKQNAIRTTQQLENYVITEVDSYRRWLAKNRTSPTMNRLRRETVQKLTYLLKVKGLVDAHLK